MSTFFDREPRKKLSTAYAEKETTPVTYPGIAQFACTFPCMLFSRKNTITGAETQLTDSPYSDAHGAWMPGGDSIAYTMVIQEGSALAREIGILSISQPSSHRRVTYSGREKALHRYPDWSPDGRWLVFVSGEGTTNTLYVAPIRGGEMVGLMTLSFWHDSLPAWSR